MNIYSVKITPSVADNTHFLVREGETQNWVQLRGWSWGIAAENCPTQMGQL